MATVSFRMDDALKKQADDYLMSLGMNLTTAFTIFVKQAVREQGFLLKYQRKFQIQNIGSY